MPIICIENNGRLHISNHLFSHLKVFKYYIPYKRYNINIFIYHQKYKLLFNVHKVKIWETSFSMNNLILSLFILNMLQSMRKCGSSSILRKVLHSCSSLLSFLYLPLSISRVCPLISPSFNF